VKKEKMKRITETDLRARGYLTVDEFVDKFSESLRGYMHSNWPTTANELQHPEDLASNALTYTEIMYRVIVDFS
jgi:hypothetical protein